MVQGIIVVDHGSRRIESNQMLEEVASLFGKRFGSRFPIVEAAHMELAEPSIETAYGRCVKRGASKILCLPYFLGMGRHWTRDIPSLLNQASAKFPGTTYQLVEPLGIDDLILDLLLKRATSSNQPFYSASEIDPRIEGQDPTQRREQCTSCPFKVMPDGTTLDTRKQPAA